MAIASAISVLPASSRSRTVVAVGAGGIAAVTLAATERSLGIVVGVAALALFLAGVQRGWLPNWWWAAAGATAGVLSAGIALDSSTAIAVTLLAALPCAAVVAVAQARELRPMTRLIVLILSVSAAVVGLIAIGRTFDMDSLLLLMAAILTTAIPHPRARHPRLPIAGPTASTAARLRYGRTHISSFASSADKRAIELPSGSVVATRVWLGVAVTAGDPLAGPEQQATAIDEFVAVCAAHGWYPCFYQTDPRLRSSYLAAGLRVAKFGEEATVDLDGFSLATPARANLRREVGRARRAGLHATVLSHSEITPVLAEELRSVSCSWITGRGAEMGFSLGRIDETIDPGGWFAVVRDAPGAIHAFSSWLRMGEDGLALDLMRRRPDATCGAVDLCLAAALIAAQQRGLRRASLGAVPYRDSLGDACDGRLTGRLRGQLYRRGMRGYRYQSLAAFKQKFAPTWTSRDVAYAPGTGLQVMLALGGVHLARSPDDHRAGKAGRGLVHDPAPAAPSLRPRARHASRQDRE
jgi:lysylphosphatidylglycerol synthetase-like protein (DUF2156 family)